jgi:hypothetical protein
VSTLDFSKLAPPKGETFEGLIRLLGERLGMVVQWSGRGADGGRDLVFIETLRGPIKARFVRWLVSCKDNSGTNRSVKERDVGSVADKVKQHRCDGFLLATTTTASSGLKELLTGLDSAERDPIPTKVWDRHELSRMLQSDDCTGLLRQFFPDYVTKEAVAKLDAAREVVEVALPRFFIGEVRQHLVPEQERWDRLSGNKVCPLDTNKQVIIDVMKADFREWLFDGHQAPRQIEGRHLDAFTLFCDAMIRNFPICTSVSFLKAVAYTVNDYDIAYDAIEMLQESNEVDFLEELELTRSCRSETLYILYRDMVEDEIEYVDWIRQLRDHILSYAFGVNKFRINELAFKGKEDEMNIEITHYYKCSKSQEERTCSCEVDGHLERTRVVVDAITFNRISNIRSI